MSELTHTSDNELWDIATKKGLKCFFPSTKELFVDLDKGAELNPRVLKTLKEHWGVYGQLSVKSSGGNRHVYIRLKKNLSSVMRVAIQSALGSDPVREILSLARVEQHTDSPTALFETPASAEKVNEWRADMDLDEYTAVTIDDDVPF